MKPRHSGLITILALGILGQFVLGGTATAQSVAPKITAEQQAEIIESLAAALSAHYVLPDKARELVDALEMATDAGAFAASKPTSEFVTQTTALLRTTANDKHLALLNPEKFDQMMAMFHGEDTDHHEEPTTDDPLSAVGVANVAEISRDGLNQTGYLALERFDGSEKAAAFLDRVFATFTECDYVIIDLRKSRGGDGEMVKTLSSYFFDEPTHLLSTMMPPDEEGTRRIFERWTEPNPLSATFANKPLTILISSFTFSAAESFSFGMQAVGRARLVGETTGGGGYINDFFPLEHGFGASISVGRTYDPRTDKDWQGIGVVPEVEIAPEQALSSALATYTRESGKLDALTGDDLAIYQRMQLYANAWYGADGDAMNRVLSDDFVGHIRNPAGAKTETISRDQLIANTASGNGQSDNEIYYNRIIRDIVVDDGQATVTLILRETILQMSLRKKGDEWLIHSYEIRDKRRSRS